MTTATAPIRRIAKLLKRSERDEIRDIAALATQLGMTVCSTQQFRASRQHEGLPDLWIFCPRESDFVRTEVLWWEGKAVNGTQSRAQCAFECLCAECGVCYGIGTLANFLDWVSHWRDRRINAPVGCERWHGKRETLTPGEG